jgi:hypothetical protein
LHESFKPDIIIRIERLEESTNASSDLMNDTELLKRQVCFDIVSGILSNE